MSGDMVVDLKDDASRERELWLRDFKFVWFPANEDGSRKAKIVPLSKFLNEGVLDENGLTVDEFLSEKYIFPSDGGEWTTDLQREIRPEGLSYSEISAITPIFRDKGEASVALVYDDSEDSYEENLAKIETFEIESPNGLDALSVAEVVFEWLKENGRDYVIDSVTRSRPKASKITLVERSFEVFKLKGIRKIPLETFDNEMDAFKFAHEEVRRDTVNRVQIESVKTTVFRPTPNNKEKVVIQAKSIRERRDETPEMVDVYSILVFGYFKKSLERPL